MKILLLGKNGQVGWELARTLLPLGEVVAMDRQQVDFTNVEVLREMIQSIHPDMIVNAVAYTAVDKAESERETAFLCNAIAVDAIAQEAKKIGALFIHYSTDYIFDGMKNTPYLEDDAVNPLNVYGESKLAGEKAIMTSGADYLILRTTWVFASRGQNFLKSILRLAAERDTLNIVADQIGAPTWARVIAQTTAHIVQQVQQERAARKFVSGVFHLTSAGDTSWHGFAQKIVEFASPHCKLKTQVISPIPTSQYPTPAKRPLNSRLCTEKLTQRFGIVMPTWEVSLKLCMEELF
jgi:dTDP-4-dehydrorhamnose reductase